MHAAPPSHDPIPVRFFPATRVGLAVGFVIAVAVAATQPNRVERDAAAAGDEPRPTEPLPLPQPQPAPLVEPPPTPAPAPATQEQSPRWPLQGPVVVHVWLQNCADCMSAFEAHARIAESGELRDVPQLNVAYGSSTPEFRARYRVERGYLEDRDGAHVVRPFGIGSFTTLVLDQHNNVVLRTRPDTNANYVPDVKLAYATAKAAATLAP